MIGTAQHRLACRTAVGRCYVVGSDKAVSTAGRQRIWIGIPLRLAVGIGRPGRVSLADGEVRACVGYVVVGEHGCWSQGRRNMIGTGRNCLTGCTTVCAFHVVPGSEPAATARSQWIWICLPVDLAAGIRRPGSILCIDGEVSACVGDVVVGEHASGGKGSSDVIGTASYVLTYCTLVCSRYVVRSHKACASARSQRIRSGIPVGFA